MASESDQERKLIRARVQNKMDITKAWNSSHLIPLSGELIIYDIDAQSDHLRFKIGDGYTEVEDLPFTISEQNKQLLDNITHIYYGIDTNPSNATERNITISNLDVKLKYDKEEDEYYFPDGTMFLLQFRNGLQLNEGKSVTISINGSSPMTLSFGGIDGLQCADSGDAHADYILWNDGILLCSANHWMLNATVPTRVYESAKAYKDGDDNVITDTYTKKSHVETEKLTVSEDSTVSSALKVRNNRIDMFKTEGGNSNVAIKKDDSVNLKNIDLNILNGDLKLSADKNITTGSLVVESDGIGSGLTVGYTTKIRDGKFLLGYNKDTGDYISYIDCGQYDDEGSDLSNLKIGKKDGAQIEFSDGVDIAGARIKISSEIDDDNILIDTYAPGDFAGVKLRARENNTNGGRNNINLGNNEIRICGDINLKDVATNCTSLPTDVTTDEINFVEGNLQSTLIDLKRNIDDCVTEEEANANYVSTSGDTIDGDLTVTGSLDGNRLKNTYIGLQGDGNIIPAIFNELAYINKLGGSAVYYITTDEDFTASTLTKSSSTVVPSTIFDNSINFNSLLLPNITDIMVIDITLPTKYNYTSTIYIDFRGDTAYVPKDIAIYTALDSSIYTLRSTQTDSNGLSFCTTTFNPGSSQFNRIRFVLKNPKNKSIGYYRVQTIGLLNYQYGKNSSIGLNGTNELCGNITPYVTDTYELGQSSKRYKNVWMKNAMAVNVYPATGSGSGSIGDSENCWNKAYIAEYNGGSINIDPETRGCVIPYFLNLLQNYTLRGYTPEIYTTTDTDYTQMDLTQEQVTIYNTSRMFNGSINFANFSLNSKDDVVVIDIPLPSTYIYGSQYYINMNSTGFQFKTASFYRINTNKETTYTKIATVTDTNATKMCISNASGTGVNKLRIVLSDATVTNPRIFEIGMLNCQAGSSYYIPKNGASDIIGDLSPFYDNKYDLGTADDKWKTVYANTFVDGTGSRLLPIDGWSSNKSGGSELYFNGYLNMKELVDTVDDVANGTHSGYIGINELAYCLKYVDDLVSGNVTMGEDNEFVGLEELASQVSDNTKLTKYSETPVKVGEWIDGTPIWRIAFNKNLSLSDYYHTNTSTIEIPCNELITSEIVKDLNNVGIVNDRVYLGMGIDKPSPCVIDDTQLTVSSYNWIREMTASQLSNYDGVWGWIEFVTPESNLV